MKTDVQAEHEEEPTNNIEKMFKLIFKRSSVNLTNIRINLKLSKEFPILVILIDKIKASRLPEIKV